jgi:hypothetical protein
LGPNFRSHGEVKLVSVVMFPDGSTLRMSPLPEFGDSAMYRVPAASTAVAIGPFKLAAVAGLHRQEPLTPATVMICGNPLAFTFATMLAHHSAMYMFPAPSMVSRAGVDTTAVLAIPGLPAPPAHPGVPSPAKVAMGPVSLEIPRFTAVPGGTDVLAAGVVLATSPLRIKELTVLWAPTVSLAAWMAAVAWATVIRLTSGTRTLFGRAIWTCWGLD